MIFPLEGRKSVWLLLAAWAALVATALFTRPLLPVDETRYVGVAWEMWLRGDFLVPFKNGVPYSDKPPLLFWLMQAGWWLFGVNELWPRLVAPLIGLGCLGLTAVLARRLWPEHPSAATFAPWLLFGCLFVAGFGTLTQFDLLIVFCTLLGMLGMQRAATGLGSGWLIVGLALGLGLLSKGPVILLHLLPVALLGHLWVDPGRLPKGWICWYGGTVAALLLGALIALAWALPAAAAGGDAYRNAIFWGQTAERMVDSFAHKAPVWWYLPWLPVLLLPWVLWPPLWRAARAAGRAVLRERPVRFLLCWALPVLIALSLISGKQVKYLLPMFPAPALLGAYWLARAEPAWQPRRQWLGVSLLVAPALLFAFASVRDLGAHVYWAGAIEPAWGFAFLAAAALWWAWRPGTLAAAVRALALAGVAVLVGIHVSILRIAAPAYDLHAMSARIAEIQAARRPILHVGKYHGQFHFLGRLTRPLRETPPVRKRVLAWARKHPQGYVVLYYDQWPWPLSRENAEFTQDFRGDPGGLALWSASKLLAASDATMHRP